VTGPWMRNIGREPEIMSSVAGPARRSGSSFDKGTRSTSPVLAQPLIPRKGGSYNVPQRIGSRGSSAAPARLVVGKDGNLYGPGLATSRAAS